MPGINGIRGGNLMSNGSYSLDPLFGINNDIPVNNQVPSIKLEFTRIDFIDKSQLKDVYIVYEGTSNKNEAIIEFNRLIQDGRVMLFKFTENNNDLYINCGTIKLYTIK